MKSKFKQAKNVVNINDIDIEDECNEEIEDNLIQTTKMFLCVEKQIKENEIESNEISLMI